MSQRRTPAVANNCGCECKPCQGGCHCMIDPCTRKRQRSNATSKQSPCGCECRKCRNKQHCQGDSCNREGRQTRRTAAQINATGRYPNGRVKPAKKRTSPAETKRVGKRQTPSRAKVVVPPQTPPDKMRAEWFVHAHKGQTAIDQACPEGKDEASRAVESLAGFGWDGGEFGSRPVAYTKSVWRDDRRFHQLKGAVTHGV